MGSGIQVVSQPPARAGKHFVDRVHAGIISRFGVWRKWIGEPRAHIVTCVIILRRHATSFRGRPRRGRADPMPAPPATGVIQVSFVG